MLFFITVLFGSGKWKNVWIWAFSQGWAEKMNYLRNKAKWLVPLNVVDIFLNSALILKLKNTVRVMSCLPWGLWMPRTASLGCNHAQPGQWSREPVASPAWGSGPWCGCSALAVPAQTAEPGSLGIAGTQPCPGWAVPMAAASQGGHGWGHPPPPPWAELWSEKTFPGNVWVLRLSQHCPSL